jgi:hypothetical protein
MEARNMLSINDEYEVLHTVKYMFCCEKRDENQLVFVLNVEPASN